MQPVGHIIPGVFYLATGIAKTFRDAGTREKESVSRPWKNLEAKDVNLGFRIQGLGFMVEGSGFRV